MSRAPRFAKLFVGLALALTGVAAQAQDLLIKHATVHTAGARGTLKDADVLVQGGLIRAVGKNLLIVPGVTVIDAKGKALTPGLFGGVGGIGLEEVSAEDSTVDSNQSFGRSSMSRSPSIPIRSCCRWRDSAASPSA